MCLVKLQCFHQGTLRESFRRIEAGRPTSDDGHVSVLWTSTSPACHLVLCLFLLFPLHLSIDEVIPSVSTSVVIELADLGGTGPAKATFELLHLPNFGAVFLEVEGFDLLIDAAQRGRRCLGVGVKQVAVVFLEGGAGRLVSWEMGDLAGFAAVGGFLAAGAAALALVRA